MVTFRNDLESFGSYKIEKTAKHNLGDNENRLIDWSGLLEEIAKEIPLSDLQYYGDNKYSQIIQAYAEHVGLQPNQIVQGVGSDQMIHTIITTFLQAGEVLLTVEPDFFMYSVFSQVHGTKLETYQLEWIDGVPSLSAEKLLEHAEKVGAKLIILSNPNNPASIAFESGELEKIVANFSGIVVIDEAYIDFAQVKSMLDKINSYDNLIVLRTMSKAFGLAGLRLGFALSCQRLAYELDKVLAPYSMPNIVGKIGVQALKHSDKVRESVTRIKEIRQDFMAFLEQHPNLHLLPSQANFITFTAPYAEKILEVGLTQDFNFKYYADGPMKGYIRMGIGHSYEMNLMKEIIRKVVKNKS